MARNRVIGFALLTTVVCAVVAFQTRDLFAQTVPPPFTWGKYKGADGKDYDSPSWNDDGGNKRTLITAQGVLTYKDTPSVTKVVFQVYRHAEGGGWNATPVINRELNPNPTYFAGLGGWLLSSGDDNVPKIRFNENEEIKIVWAVTRTDGETVAISNVELIILVKYH
ncbi:MAG TPA: hypothetical protein VM529_13505 [Gemmata sp.]|nr:hypothetical protein [Gemmata sp.]